MNVKFEPVRVATGSDDNEGQLAFAGDQLIAVLVRLSEIHPELAGSWFVEATFGLRDAHRTFPDLNSAEEWLLSKLQRHANR